MPDGESVEYSGNDPGSGGGTHAGGTSSGSDGGYYEEHPYLTHDDQGNECVGTEYRRYDTQAEAQAAAEQDDPRWQRLTRDYPLCPQQPAPAGSSASEAQAFWGTVPLPKPSPYIAPGWAVTGRKSFLETRSQPSATFTRDTPRGELTLDATGPYYVDWGDGTQSGPYDDPGGPWPNGVITHVYENVGTYNVVVTQRWSATWRMSDGESGRLGGLQTVGRIDGFRVEQLQAVRNR